MADFDWNILLSNIEKCDFFSAMPQEKLFELLPKLECVSISAQDILFYQGEISDFLYILIQGELVATLSNIAGEKTIVGVIKPFETVGELSLISGDRRSLTIQAITDAQLLKLPNQLCLELCKEYPAILHTISKLISHRTLKIIKLLTKEKHNLSILLPFLEKEQMENLRNRLNQAGLNGYPTLFINETTSLNEIKVKLANIPNDENYIFLFMEIYNESILNEYLKKSNHLYLLLSEDSKKFSLRTIEEMLKFLQFQRSDLRLELVLLHPADTKYILNTQKWLKIANFDLHHHVRWNNEPDFQRLVRFMTGKATTLVLGGGGAKGIGHLGVIKALVDKNIPIDAIAGTSIGAGIAGCFAMTLNYQMTLGLVNKLAEASTKSVSFKSLTYPIISLFTSDPATKQLLLLLDHINIEDLPIPFFAISSNLSEKKEIVHRSGLLWEAIRSSVALPGIFPPVVIDGQIHFDGGLLNNLPVDSMRQFVGYPHTIIASCLSKQSRFSQSYNFPPVITLKDAIFYKLRISKRNFTFPPFFATFLDALLLGSSAREESNCILADILIKPDLSEFKLLKVIKKRADELHEITYNETIKAIEKYKKV